MRRVDPEIRDQRLGKAFHGKLGCRIGGVGDVGADGGPEAVDAAGVDDVGRVGGPQQWQEGAGGEVDAAPTDIEGPLPLLAAVDHEAAAAADAGIVEQEVDPVCRMLRPDLVAKAQHVDLIGDVCQVRGEAHTLRLGRCSNQPLRLREPTGRDIAHGDGAALGDQLAHKFSPHA